MEFISVGYNFCHNKNFKISRPDGLDYYLFLLLRSNAYYLCKNEKQIIPENSVILFDRETPQFFGAVDDNYINDWVAFSLNRDEEKWFHSLKLPKDKFFQVPATGFFDKIIELMHGEFVFLSEKNSIVLKKLFAALCEKYKEITVISGETNLPYYNELASLRNAIYDYPANKYTIELLADKIHVSKSYFSHLYKKYFGISPMNDVIRSKIEYSKQLLLSTSYSVAQISELLNYSCDTQFMKQFKIFADITPSEYRKITKLKRREKQCNYLM